MPSTDWGWGVGGCGELRDTLHSMVCSKSLHLRPIRVKTGSGGKTEWGSKIIRTEPFWAGKHRTDPSSVILGRQVSCCSLARCQEGRSCWEGGRDWKEGIIGHSQARRWWSKAVSEVSVTGTKVHAKCSPKCQRLIHRYLYKIHVRQRDSSLNQLGSWLYFLSHWKR